MRVDEYDEGSSFSGTPRALHFTRVTREPVMSQDSSDIQRVQYSLRDSQNEDYSSGKYLERLYTSALDGNIPTDAKSSLLLSKVISLKFSYLDRENNYQANWPPEFYTHDKTELAENRLPKAIRLDIELEDFKEIYRVFEIGAVDYIFEEESL